MDSKYGFMAPAHIIESVSNKRLEPTLELKEGAVKWLDCGRESQS